jgi:hypothetical protein
MTYNRNKLFLIPIKIEQGKNSLDLVVWLYSSILNDRKCTQLLHCAQEFGLSDGQALRNNEKGIGGIPECYHLYLIRQQLSSTNQQK